MELGPQAPGPTRCATPKPDAAREMLTAQPLPVVTHRVPYLVPVLVASTAAHSPGTRTTTPPRLTLEEVLPADVLEVVLGFLDRKTLCSARLVSKTFCAAASANICHLILRSNVQGVSRHRFPQLRSGTLHICRKGEGLGQVEPYLLELVTKLTLPWARPEDCQALITETLSHSALLPKLRALLLQSGFGTEARAAELLRRYTNLETIRISGGCSFPVGEIIGAMTLLRELRIGRVYRPGDWAGPSWDRPSADASWLQATALRNLRALRIATPSEALRQISNLTGLTGLTWMDATPPLMIQAPYSIAPLTRLTRFRSVSFRFLKSESNVGIACSLGAGSLADLAIGAPCDSGRFLTRQMALTRLTEDEHLCDLRRVGALRLELLRSLELERLTGVGC